MKNIGSKYSRLMKTLGFLGLFIALFFSYRFISAEPSSYDAIEFSQEEYTTLSGGTDTEFATHSESNTHYNSKFRHTVRKRGLSRNNNYLKRTVHFLSAKSNIRGGIIDGQFRGYAWLYHRPSYYVHLFRYALF